MEILSPQLQSYLDKHTDAESPLLAHINRETHLKVSMPRMLSGHFQGRLLSMFSHLTRPRRILEIGTYTGYATLCLAEGLPDDGLIHTIDINEELMERVRGYFAQSAFNDKIVQHTGNALDIIPTLADRFDLVFIDADKRNNENYYDLVINLLNPGGLILVDNVLWSGKVVEENNDKDTLAILKFNEKIANDPRTAKLIVPVRDGLFAIRKL
ncbi:O-methyltransferase [Hufsiella ginkgonis]|uniref:Methyltransferase domain-containing protein n=1 Tax=Hufsiella ginkgonis TaxID=2695274 RepID=A0A7K1XUT5_9SPHI|nr:O-methyltransferase [Hufsiella ginkgonis]MXV14775.1 methyltransferase domain-containing protein [Hufsiella ginkgonis]